jgi:hypothetical protein
MIEALEILATTLATLTSLAMILTSERRLGIGLLAFQYLAVFLLIEVEWSLIQALTILIAGWIAGVVLGMAGSSVQINRLGKSQIIENPPSLNPFFNFLSSLIICLIVFSLAFQVKNWIPALDTIQSWTALLLISLGILHLILKIHPIAMTLALLTMLSGFEILFSGLTSSILAAAFLAGITLFISLSGAYLYLSPLMEE